MTKRQVAFLRALNVGGRRLKMDELQAHVHDLGFEDPQTHGASGNVVIESDEAPDALEQKISEGLADALGYEVPTFVRTMDDLAAIAGTRLFLEEAAEPRTKQYVSFLHEPLTAEQVETLEGLNNDVDQFAVEGSQIHWFRRMDAGESLANTELEKALGVDATRRTLDTVKRIVAKYAGGAPS